MFLTASLCWDHRAVIVVLFLTLMKSPNVSHYCWWRNTMPVCTIMISVYLFLVQRALSFCCSDIPYAAYRITSQVQTVLSYKRRTTFVPADLFQLWRHSSEVYRKSSVTERLLIEKAYFECSTTNCWGAVLSGSPQCWICHLQVEARTLQCMSVWVCAEVGL